MSARPTVTAQLAALHAAAAGTRTQTTRALSDEQILAEDLAQHRAEEHARDRAWMTDWTAARWSA